jgi:DNA repair protein RecN (Recombination protein N)
VAANAGQDLRPLAKVASGGELSRIGLALQVIASQANTRRHADLRRSRCRHRRPRRRNRRPHAARAGQEPAGAVRHAPAAGGGAGRLAMVNRQAIRATARRRRRCNVLDAEARIGEIARMLGGEKITDTTRRHAAEMLGALRYTAAHEVAR